MNIFYLFCVKKSPFERLSLEYETERKDGTLEIKKYVIPETNSSDTFDYSNLSLWLILSIGA